MMSFDAVDATRVGAEFDNYEPATGLSIISGRYGGQALSIKQIFGSNYFAGNFLNSSNCRTLIQGVDLQFIGTGIEQTPIFALLNTSDLSPGSFPGINVVVNVHSDGSLLFYAGSNLTTYESGTLLYTTSSGVIQLGKWQHIEWKVYIDSSAGTITCNVDNTNVATLTSLNTQNGADNYAISAALVSFNGSGTIAQNYDNFYVLDTNGSSYNDIIGPQGMDVHLPDSAGAYTNWTPLSAPNWSQVDDYANSSSPSASPVPDDSATYNYSVPSVSNVVDTYPVNLFGEREQHAIQFTFRASSSVASGNRVIQATIYDGSSLFTGSNIALNASDTNWYSYRDVSFAVEDPSTSSPWTTTLLNARQFGVTNYGNYSGGGDTANAEVTQIKITRMYPAYNLFVANHPLWITG